MSRIRICAVFCLHFILSACSGGAGTVDAPESSIATPALPLPGNFDLEFPLEEDSIGRSSARYTPRGLTGAAPLMVILQPGFGTAAGFISLIDVTPLADRHQFRIIAPRAGLLSWNSGAERGGGYDDVAFIRQEVRSLIAAGQADPGQIWLVGMSAGGFMAHRMLCEASDLFAAAAMVGSTATDEAPPGGIKAYPCVNPSPVPILTINGLSDTCVPFDGGETTGLRRHERRSIPSVTMEWAGRHQCASVSEFTTAPGVNCSSYRSCAGGSRMQVQQCAIDHAGHGWPGAGPELFNGMCGGERSAFNATEAIWSFIAAAGPRR